MAAADSSILTTPLGHVDLSDAILDRRFSEMVLEFLIEDINLVIDAILECVSGMRMEKQISVDTRDEIVKEIASIKATDLNTDLPNQHSLNKVLFTELNLSLRRMQNGVYDRWYHGE